MRSRSQESTPILPSFSDFGWVRCIDGKWLPKWLGSLPPASKVCHETIRFGCKKGCERSCRRRKFDLNSSHYAGANQNALIVELVIILFA